jgi:plastocyanin
MRHRARLISSVLLSAALAGCGGGGVSQSGPPSPSASGQSSVAETPSTTTASPSNAPVAGPQIVISNMAYTVPPSVRPGQQLSIVNNDEMNHTVTSDQNGLFDIVASGSGGVTTFTAPATPGTYPFHCKYHANMHGVLTVQ